jgi:hypothetical protein
MDLRFGETGLQIPVLFIGIWIILLNDTPCPSHLNLKQALSPFPEILRSTNVWGSIWIKHLAFAHLRPGCLVLGLWSQTWTQVSLPTAEFWEAACLSFSSVKWGWS